MVASCGQSFILYHFFNSTIISISTAIFFGNEHMPTAERACFPFSPNTFLFSKHKLKFFLACFHQKNILYIYFSQIHFRLSCWCLPGSRFHLINWLNWVVIYFIHFLLLLFMAEHKKIRMLIFMFCTLQLWIMEQKYTYLFGACFIQQIDGRTICT